MSAMRMVLMAAVAVVVAVAMAALALQYVGSASPQPSREAGANASAAERPPAREFPRELLPGRDFVINKTFSVGGRKVRDLRPVEGVFIYNTSVVETYKGPSYTVYRYEVSRLNETTYMVVRNETDYHPEVGVPTPKVDVFLVRNNTIYHLATIAGGTSPNATITYKWDTVRAPVSPDCILILVAPPFWPYVAEGARWRVTLLHNATYRYADFKDVVRGVEEAWVERIVDCRGPSGRCYVVRSQVQMESTVGDLKGERTRTMRDVYSYLFHVDVETGVVVYAVYHTGVRVKLVKWRLGGHG